MKILILLLLLGCEQAIQKDYDDRLKDIDNRIDVLTDLIATQGLIIDALKVADDSVKYKLIEVDSAIQDLKYALDTNATQILNIKSQLDKLNTIVLDLSIKNNVAGDWTELEGCDHSFFLLYNYNGTVRSLYVNELASKQRMLGAWDIWNLPQNYGLAIGNELKCTRFTFTNNSIKYYRLDNSSWVVINL